MTGPAAGRPVYGHPAGSMMLDTVFPRPPGDIGNAATWPFPMLYRIVRGAVPQRALAADPSLLEPFIEAAEDLVASGVRAVTTSCGYLAAYQRELAAAISVPVLTSSLLQVPLAQQLAGPNGKVGIVSIRDMLTEQHFAGAGWSAQEIPVVVRSLSAETLFTRVHAPLGEPENLSATAGQFTDEIVATVRELVTQSPEVRVIVMECTNLVPYSQAVRRATGLVVLDHYTLVMNAYRSILGTEFAEA